jgi:GAF domain-containing protein
MLESLLNYLKSEDDTDPSFIVLIRNILFIITLVNLAVLPLVTGIAGEGTQNIIAFTILTITLLLETVALYYVRRGNLIPAKLIVPISLIIAITTIAINTNGLRDTSYFSLPVILVISAVLLGRRSLIFITPVAVATTIFVAISDLTQPRQVFSIGIDDAIILPILLVSTSVVLHILIIRLNESTQRSRQNELAYKLENEELTSLRRSLEAKVADRTSELETANRTSEKQARQFRAVAQVMNAISSVQSLDNLLPLITSLISQQFGVYHVGIFLTDEEKEYAILRAANSEGGQRMLDRKHSLPVGQTGIVGFVTATGQPRIALDVGTDSVFFNNPDLPETRSEIALPLQYGGEIIGALDVQSTEPNAFQAGDLEVLTTLANQVAVAINNANVLEEAQRALAEAQSAVGQIAHEAWQVLRPAELGLGFSYSDTGIKPLQHPIENPQVAEAISEGKTVLATGTGNWSRMAIPVRLRGQIIGVIQLSSRSDYQLTNEDAEIAEAVSERLSLAIETATLLQSSQRRADLEKITSNITSKVSSSTRFETILQTAAKELSNALGGSDVIVQIEPASLQMNP